MGRKTAACVLLFSFGRPDIPVDTHVYRVGTRLGLFRPGGRRSTRRTTRCCGSVDARGRLRDRTCSLIRHGRRTCTRAQPALRGVPAAVAVPVRPGARQVTAGRRREVVAELGLVGIAAVWGATFTVVQDAIERLPAMAFLGYRFTAAALLVAVIFRAPAAGPLPAGWRAGLAMGAFLTAGYVLQTLALERTTASNAGFITGLFVVITPLLAALVLRERIGRTAWIAACVSALGLYLLSGTHG